MTERGWDLIFMGGGFAAGLAVLRLAQVRPNLRCLVLEKRSVFGDDQTWSFQSLAQESDSTPSRAFVNPRQSWLAPLLGGAWDRYEVQFPKLRRVLEHSYYSIRSNHFFDYIQQQAPGVWRLGENVVSFGPQHVETEAGQRYEASAVIDCRGWGGRTKRPCGYQKFLGLQLKLKEPHGLEHPVVMDACLPQEDGFRFLYALPWSRDTLLLEDTHYSNTPEIDEEHYEHRILEYAAAKSWSVEGILGRERGSLPIPFQGEPWPQEESCTLGMRAGLFHATTGYSIYEAVMAAEVLAELPELSHVSIAKALRELSRQRWQAQSFYRKLNNMLFHATPADERYRVLESFYRHPHDLLARFYAGHTNARDKMRILSRKPPVPLWKGIYYFFYSFGAAHDAR